MIRAILFTLGIFSTVLVLAEVSAVGLLWSRGLLTPTSLREVRLALSGQSITEPLVDEEVMEKNAASEAEIREQRIRRALELDARENELSLLKRMTTETANRLISDRQSFDQLKDQFRTELSALQAQTTAAATEQTRAILLASPPEEAVRDLQGLSVTEGVDLLRGLPEKSIARILLAFQTDPQTAARGMELFKGIYRGDPNRQLIDSALRELDPNSPLLTTPTTGGSATPSTPPTATPPTTGGPTP
jgi:hypothetical protein